MNKKIIIAGAIGILWGVLSTWLLIGMSWAHGGGSFEHFSITRKISTIILLLPSYPYHLLLYNVFYSLKINDILYLITIGFLSVLSSIFIIYTLFSILAISVRKIFH